ncbi:MAG: hypothetical protein C0514_06295 [Candidatus Puniceispirillum sp.]|nr:hypothetical protein [Candidatus Puniceispirillum sp.]
MIFLRRFRETACLMAAVSAVATLACQEPDENLCAPACSSTPPACDVPEGDVYASAPFVETLEAYVPDFDPAVMANDYQRESLRYTFLYQFEQLLPEMKRKWNDWAQRHRVPAQPDLLVSIAALTHEDGKRLAEGENLDRVVMEAGYRFAQAHGMYEDLSGTVDGFVQDMGRYPLRRALMETLGRELMPYLTYEFQQKNAQSFIEKATVEDLQGLFSALRWIGAGGNEDLENRITFFITFCQYWREVSDPLTFAVQSHLVLDYSLGKTLPLSVQLRALSIRKDKELHGIMQRVSDMEEEKARAALSFMHFHTDAHVREAFWRTTPFLSARHICALNAQHLEADPLIALLGCGELDEGFFRELIALPSDKQILKIQEARIRTPLLINLLVRTD